MYKLKIKTFIHQNIPYSFNWNKEHHKEKYSQIISNREELNRLKDHFKKIYEGIIPNNLFNSREFPRVSQFKIRGIKSAFVRSYSKNLIRSGKIRYYDSESKLPKYAQKVFENFQENNISGVPGHEPILKNILLKDKDAVAIEVPIWDRKHDMAITGHIDLIQIENDIVKVIDYKPEGNFLLSLPQVAMYGFLVKSKLSLRKVRCVSFNKRGAWEYDPNILKEEIKDYLLSQNIEERPWENFI
ncbi:MAG: hypothetical protein ACFFAA_08970 [Promethearchaeota archaeon]